MDIHQETFAKSEAQLFMCGDAELGRTGLVQLAGGNGSADEEEQRRAIVLLDELLFGEGEASALTEAFVGMGKFNVFRKMGILSEY